MSHTSDFNLPLSKNHMITKQAEDRLLVAATMEDTQQLRWCLLVFGDQVEVVEPVELKDEFIQTVKRMSDLYQGRKCMD